MASTITLTFGDVAENHRGMQKLGDMAKTGFTKEDLDRAERFFKDRGCEAAIRDLRDLLPEDKRQEAREAYVLIARKGVNALDFDPVKLHSEQESLPKDTKAFMYGRVVQKHARHNLCFAESEQEPDYEKGRGRVVAFTSVPELSRLRAILPDVIGEGARDLLCEGNYYYDIRKCGIGWHGDSERKKVIAVRLGASIPIGYYWYQGGKRVGNRFQETIDDGDIYIMSDKAVGWDWRCRKPLTLRHAAGSAKFMA